jgi:hypothetical protein
MRETFICYSLPIQTFAKWDGQRQSFGRHDDPAQAVFVNRCIKISRPDPPLDLDEGDCAPAFCHQIDFAARHAAPLRKNAPSMKAQIPCSKSFRASPALFRAFAPAAHALPVSARARA